MPWNCLVRLRRALKRGPGLLALLSLLASVLGWVLGASLSPAFTQEGPNYTWSWLLYGIQEKDLALSTMGPRILSLQTIAKSG